MAQLSNHKEPFLPLFDGKHSFLLYKILSSTLLNNNLFRSLRPTMKGYLGHSQPRVFQVKFSREQNICLKEKTFLKREIFLKCIKYYLIFINKPFLNDSDH